MRGFLDGLNKTMQSPLFLGGAALLSGEGMAGAMRGMQVGNQFAQQQREEEEAERRRQGFLSLVSSPEIGGKLSPELLQLAQAAGPETGMRVLAEQLDPATLLQRRQAEENLALMPLKRRQMERELAQPVGGGAPRYGMQPIYGTDENGNIVVMQPSSTGELVQSRLPPGVRVDPGLAAGAKAKATAEGKWEGGADQRNVGKERLSGQLADVTRNYLTLDQGGGIVNPDRGTMENLSASARSSAVGQTIGNMVGTEDQSIRNRIQNVRPLLMQGIMQASGMSARALDSNRELDFYLRAATDPTQDIYANLVAIDVLDRTYGLGNVLEGAVPPEVMARVRQGSEAAIKARPIPQPSPDDVTGTASQGSARGMPPGARQAPDGNFYIPDPNRPGKYLKVE